MKKLYLLRHAKSAHPQGIDDHNRPLDEEGKRECKVMSAYFIKNNVKPGLVLCSDSVRTTNTAKNIFQDIRTINIVYNKKLYNATAGEILKEIAKVPDDSAEIMVIGHNPGIGQLAFILAGQGDKDVLAQIKSEYPTCALTEYSFNIEKWNDIGPGVGKLERFVK